MVMSQSPRRSIGLQQEFAGLAVVANAFARGVPVNRAASAQSNVAKMADDRAEQLKRDPDAVAREVERRLRADLRKVGDFSRIHPLPQSSADVPDDLDARLVVLGIDQPYSKEPGSPAEKAAKALLEYRGNVPRLFRNTLVFLAVDKTRLQDLDEAIRRYLAWQSILEEKEGLNLDPHHTHHAGWPPPT
jgi:hypothetical protein